MTDLVTIGERLPEIPLKWIHPLEGKNLVLKDLKGDFGVRTVDANTAETAIARFRAEHNPQNQPYFRRYYLKQRKNKALGGQPTYSLFYVWHTSSKKSHTDEFIGVVIGDDIEMALVMIGNHASRCFMTPISWI